MAHSVTCKLNKDANQHQTDKGTIFFVSLGEKVYNRKTNSNEYTNYEAALFASAAQVAHYTTTLVSGTVIEVSGTGILMDPPTDPKYKARLIIQDAKLGYTFSPDGGQPQRAPQQQAAPQQYQQAPQQAPQQYQQPHMQQQAPQQPQQPQYENQDVPF